jgi:hypothetical protein
MSKFYYLGLVLLLLSLVAPACQDDDPFTLSAEELAEQIRRNTPTELPPITTSGENTMGAWIHPQPGSPLHDLAGDSILFVASGVDRPETALAESLDCNAFNNFHYLSTRSIFSSGKYCSRPEIGDERELELSFGYFYPDSARVLFFYEDTDAFTYRSESIGLGGIIYDILLDNRSENVISGTFSGALINRSSPYDTIRVSTGRYDVTYGITP